MALQSGLQQQDRHGRRRRQRHHQQRHRDTASYTSPAGNGCSAQDGSCSSGAPGGGIIILRAQSITGSGTIYARGGIGYNTLNDAAGGGGGGGSVVLQTQLGGYATVNVSGGDGGVPGADTATTLSTGTARAVAAAAVLLLTRRQGLI